MSTDLDLGAIKAAHARLLADAINVTAGYINGKDVSRYGEEDPSDDCADILNAAPALIAEVERMRQRVTDLIESNNRYEQQARDARKSHAANGKILEAVQLALVRSEEEAEKLEKELANAKKIGAAEWQPIETAPKDGTVVDLWVPATKDFPAQIFSDCWYFNGRWALAGFDIEFSWLQKATNWLPKPEPPAELRAEVAG